MKIVFCKNYIDDTYDLNNRKVGKVFPFYYEWFECNIYIYRIRQIKFMKTSVIARIFILCNAKATVAVLLYYYRIRIFQTIYTKIYFYTYIRDIHSVSQQSILDKLTCRTRFWIVSEFTYLFIYRSIWFAYFHTNLFTHMSLGMFKIY